MYAESVGYLHTLCFIGLFVCISHADELIHVFNATCGETYDINYYDNITLVHENNDGARPNTRCVFTFVNKDFTREICIRDRREEYEWFSMLDCKSIFSYHPGKLSPHSYEGYSCSRFRSDPFCTRESTVYAAFWYRFYFGQTKLIVEIFWREAGVATTTTRRTTTTTEFRYSFEGDKDFDDDYESDHSADLIRTFIVIVVVCVITAFFTLIYNRICSYRAGNRTRNEFYQQQTYRSEDQTYRPVSGTHSPVNQTHPSINRVSIPAGLSRGSDRHTSDVPPHTDDAPSYSSVMQNQQLPEEGDGDGHIPDQSVLAHQGALPQNQNLSHDLPDSSNTNDELLPDVIPEDPPPDYADVVSPPPPYPGY